jgi:hypothetical protein
MGTKKATARAVAFVPDIALFPVYRIRWDEPAGFLRRVMFWFSIWETGDRTPADELEGNELDPNLEISRRAGPLQNSPKFSSAFSDFGLGAFFNLTFGNDSSLTTSGGWDNVTGMGTPSSARLPNSHSMSFLQPVASLGRSHGWPTNFWLTCLRPQMETSYGKAT